MTYSLSNQNRDSNGLGVLYIKFILRRSHHQGFIPEVNSPKLSLGHDLHLVVISFLAHLCAN